ncbi:RNA-binding protein [Haloprofundus marisrubri]|uniref:Probable ribonuclease FAU-1 n=1 Tax=Haloprofundus marisrubri TaxID=1514971 RepID=A0A0W1RBN9_9EURY|nr:DUF402 domain-containing protein [Haloprofundus marisrubri]KTG10811.1 RNA-binding protein [Haloprofundus marisrubri]
MKVRVRGIYTTALTRLFLDAGDDVVQASGPIRRRFDESFDADSHDVAVETTTDRQGVGVAGDETAVEDARERLRGVGVDAFAWTDPAPEGAVFDAEVTETLGGGAVVDLGVTDGYLPYRNADDHVETGDALRVQVTSSSPPWDDDRPQLGTEIRAHDGLVTLVPGQEGTTVATHDDAAGRELAGMTDLLDPKIPDGWGIRWRHSATEADMGALREALDGAAERARAMDAALSEPIEDPGVVVPAAGAWVWFGRESRFELDALRREVSTTMPGHHRTKAAANAASSGVDLAEALCTLDGDGEFPFGVVADQFGPVEGDTVSIGHGKPDGRLITLGSGEVVERDDEGTVAVERSMSGGGRYDALGTRRESGDTALTKFREGRWWYPTVYRGSDGERKGTYVNICTPVECFPDEIRYVDLHVDVVKHPDGSVERVDDDELDAAVEAGHISEQLAEKTRAVASSLETALGS